MVLKLEQDRVVECSHSILAPVHSLNQATGGMLTSVDMDGMVAVICGGQDSNINGLMNQKCFVLNEEEPPSAVFSGPIVDEGEWSNQSQFTISAQGNLNSHRIGSASMVVDSGSSLWMTGGLKGGWGRDDSEIVTASRIEDNIVTRLVSIRYLSIEY